MRRLLPALLLILTLLVGCGVATVSQAETPKRFRVVYEEDVDEPGWSNTIDKVVILRDTKTGTCWLWMWDDGGNNGGAGVALAPKEVCE